MNHWLILRIQIQRAGLLLLALAFGLTVPASSARAMPDDA
jgi:hypothetical protein